MSTTTTGPAARRASPPAGAPVPQLLLPGQAAAPAGPVDMSVMYALHHGFRRDLLDLGAAARRTPGADRPTWALLARRWRLYERQLHAHHTKEDEILWPELVRRARAAADGDAVRVLAEMEAEHAVLDPLLREVRVLFAHAAALASHRADHGDDCLHRWGLVDPLAALQQALGALWTALDGHLAHEERTAMAVLQRHLPADAWLRLERERFGEGTTLADACFLVPWLLKGLDDDQARHLWGVVDPAFRVVWRLCRRSFARRERRTFRYLDRTA